MLRFICALVGFMAATLPLRAEPLPQGEFMLGTYIWPEIVLPRYATLRIEGEEVSVEFSYPLPLDFIGCEERGACAFHSVAAIAQASLEDGVVRIDGIEEAADAVIDPDLLQRYGQPDHQFYTYPLFGLLHRASVQLSETGFELEGAGGTLEFFRLEGMAQEAAMVLAITHGASITEMAHCDVRQIVPMFLRPDTDPRVFSVLAGFIHQWKLTRARGPLNIDDLTPEEMKRRTLRQVASSLPSYAAAFAPEPGSAFREVFWDTLGQNVFEGDRAAYDSILAGYGDGLDELVAYHRRLKAAEPVVSAKALCADPFLGLL